MGSFWRGGITVTRPGGATVSLMRVALGIDCAVVFFGLLTLRGLGVIDEADTWWVALASVAALLVVLGLIRTVMGVWLGHLVHLGLLGLFFIDTAVGLSTLVPASFWLYAVVKGPQLDRASGDGSPDS